MSSRRALARRSLTVAALLGFAVGCQAILGEKPGEFSDAPALGTVDWPGASTRFRRLTHLEWENTVRDLFGWRQVSGFSQYFRADPRQGGFLFEGNGDSLKVDQALFGGYQRAAQELASFVTESSTELARVAPEVSGQAESERARRFIESFGARVHRRPLPQAEVARYVKIFEAGKTAYDDRSGFAAGARLVLEAMFQSPHFLYRVEQSREVDSGTIALDGYERAARLSYLLWASLPDAALFEAAAQGRLDDPAGVRKEAERMIDDPRAREVVHTFFQAVLDVERYERIAPSSNFYPDAPTDLAALAREETRRFVVDHVFGEDNGFRELITSNVTFVNQSLADIYGLEGTFGSTFRRVELDSSERSGFLTQVGFLASHATSVDPDPIHRGVFLAKRFACIKVSAPPDQVPPLPEPGDKSNRTLVEEHTEAPGTSCRNCHSTVINPFGFAYENYDSVGAYRTTDRGHQVDSSVEPPIDGEYVAVRNAVELSSVLADSEEVHACLVGHLLEFAQGRRKEKADEFLIGELGSASRAGSLGLREIMIEIAVSRSFMDRAADEGGEP